MALHIRSRQSQGGAGVYLAEGIGPAWSVVHVARPGIESELARQFLGLSDDAAFDGGEVFVLVDPSIEPGQALGAAALVIGAGRGERELRRIAVGGGSCPVELGRRLMQDVGNALRARGVGLLCAGPTAAADDLGDLLLAVGFRPCSPHRHIILEL